MAYTKRIYICPFKGKNEVENKTQITLFIGFWSEPENY